MRLLYLHGFNSNEHGRTASVLKAYYKEALVSISYDYINPDRAHQQIEMAIRDIFKDDTELLLIGNSLGGFWANYFAQRYNVKCFLINPSLQPSSSLRKYIGENINFQTGEKRLLTGRDCEAYKAYEGPIVRHTFRMTVLGTLDDVIDPNATMRQLEGLDVTVLPDEGHQIQNTAALIPLINRAINTIAG